MSVVRIFQIAKELNISHTDILSFLNKKGVDVKSHMSPVDEEVKNLIMAEFSKMIKYQYEICLTLLQFEIF